MLSSNRTLICLAAKRSGTTAIHHIFAKHPQVKIVHPDQQVDNNEPNFWNFATSALRDPDEHIGNNQSAYERFVKQVAVIAPSIPVPTSLTEKIVFELWDDIVQHYGGLVFDKSPRYLEFEETILLLQRYKDVGRDVRFFGIMRAPWDTISSQFELWEYVFPQGTPEFRDQKWLEYYQRFERLQTSYDTDVVPLYYYEHVANNPQQYIPHLLAHCGLSDVPESYTHFHPVSVGRYYRTQHPKLRSWKPSPDLLRFAEKHGYEMLSTSQQYLIRMQNRIQAWRKLTQRIYYKLKSITSSID